MFGPHGLFLMGLLLNSCVWGSLSGQDCRKKNVESFQSRSKNAQLLCNESSCVLSCSLLLSLLLLSVVRDCPRTSLFFFLLLFLSLFQCATGPKLKNKNPAIFRDTLARSKKTKCRVGRRVVCKQIVYLYTALNIFEPQTVLTFTKMRPLRNLDIVPPNIVNVYYFYNFEYGI